MNSKSVMKKLVIGGAMASGLVLTGAGVAQASTVDPVLHAHAESDYKASCSWAIDADWVRSTNHLTARVWLDNHEAFSACRKNVDATFVDEDGTEYKATVAIDTAAGTWDPTAPHTINQQLGKDRAVPNRDAPYIDHMTVTATDRPK